MLDFKQITHAFAHTFFQGDDYLVVEILNHYAQVTVLKADLAKKKILVQKSWACALPERTVQCAAKEVRALCARVRKPEKYHIVISVDSHFATTIFSSVPLVRSARKEPIDEADLDNLISQGIWRFFDRNRYKVARKMDIDEVDVLLSDVRIRGIKLDGHKIVNPIGFKAKSVEIYFSQTFVARELMKELRDILPVDRIVFLTESGVAISHMMRRAADVSHFHIANVFPTHTAVFASLQGRVSHVDNFEWGERDLLQIVSRHLRVDEVTARDVMDVCTTQSASPMFLRRIENILLKELQMFANGLESLAHEDISLVYINPFFTAPPVVFEDRFRARFQKPMKLELLSTSVATEKLGFEVKFKKSAKPKNPLSLLAAFLEVSFLPQNDKMSHLANRRVRWLVT